MRPTVELLIALYKLYSEDKLTSYFNKTTNKMENIPELVALMEEVHDYVPKELKPLEAAKAMKEIPTAEVDEAIATSAGKVVDLRAEFAKRIAVNKGLQGLAESLVTALRQENQEAVQLSLLGITTLVDYNNGEMPKEV